MVDIDINLRFGL